MSAAKHTLDILEALEDLKAAVEFTPLGVRGIKAVERARQVIETTRHPDEGEDAPHVPV